MGTKKGEGKPLTMQQVVDAIEKRGISDVTLIKVPSQELVFLVRREALDWQIVPVSKGRKHIKNLGALTVNEWVDRAQEAYRSVHPPSIVEGRFILVAGDAFSGFGYYGPFSSEDAAQEWASELMGEIPTHIIEVDDKGGRKCV